MEYSGAGEKLIHEKNQKQKISWHCPFKFEVYYNRIYTIVCHLLLLFNTYFQQHLEWMQLVLRLRIAHLWKKQIDILTQKIG